jgi:hypothetical protein
MTGMNCDATDTSPNRLEDHHMKFAGYLAGVDVTMCAFDCESQRRASAHGRRLAAGFHFEHTATHRHEFHGALRMSRPVKVFARGKTPLPDFGRQRLDANRIDEPRKAAGSCFPKGAPGIRFVYL